MGQPRERLQQRGPPALGRGLQQPRQLQSKHTRSMLDLRILGTSPVEFVAGLQCSAYMLGESCNFIYYTDSFFLISLCCQIVNVIDGKNKDRFIAFYCLICVISFVLYHVLRR
ncbi:unnamed protein product [Urochloa humidicola]